MGKAGTVSQSYLYYAISSSLQMLAAVVLYLNAGLEAEHFKHWMLVK